MFLAERVAGYELAVRRDKLHTGRQQFARVHAASDSILGRFMSGTVVALGAVRLRQDARVLLRGKIQKGTDSMPSADMLHAHSVKRLCSRAALYWLHDPIGE